MTEELRRSLSLIEKQMGDLTQFLHLQNMLAGMMDEEDEDKEGTSPTAAAERQKQRQFATVARDVERWARDMFAETESDG